MTTTHDEVDTEAKETAVPQAEPTTAEQPAAAPVRKDAPQHAVHGNASTEEADSLETEQMVVFQLQNEEYASPILDVQEIIPTGDITPFPNAPAYVAGIINIRGTVATVVNLAKRFGLTSENGEGERDQYVILTNVGKSLFGIMVDNVTSVMKIPTNKIKSASAVSDSKIHTDYVNGVAVVDGRVILILDFKKILDEEAIMNVAAQAGL